MLRLLKKELSPKGDRSGRILISGENIDDLDSAEKIGFVMQSPDEQIVTDTVWHELAFGLENIGMKREKIALRIAEIASYFGMSAWYDKKTSELSGGQKQMLNLAAVMAMSPDILILDEPTSQLDPIAASEFISTVKKLNRELSLTVIITEHRLEEVIPVSDRIMIMKDRGIAHLGSPRDIVSRVGDSPEILASMPSAAQLYHAVDGEGQCPLDVREGKRFIETGFRAEHTALTSEKYTHSEEKALEFKQVFFRYTRETQDVLDSLSLTVYSGEAYFILGGNGSGKTTFIKLLCRLYDPQEGEILLNGIDIRKYNYRDYMDIFAVVFQDFQLLSQPLGSNVGCSESYDKSCVLKALSDAGFAERLVTLPDGLDTLLYREYGDNGVEISGGEAQKIAIARALYKNAPFLILDEPTAALDPIAEAEIYAQLNQRVDDRTAIYISHRLSSCRFCDEIIVFDHGQIIQRGTHDALVSKNGKYSQLWNAQAQYYE